MLRKFIKPVIAILLMAAIVWVILNRETVDAELLEQWITEAGILGPIVFMFVYAMGTVLFFPGSVLTLAGGAVFGPVWGTFYNLTGATLGGAIAFLIARYLTHDWVEAKIGGRMKRLKQGVEGEGWRFVAFVRLVPLFPFNLLNYALGLTRIRFFHYVMASYLFMLPGAIAYTYLGYVGREAVAGEEGLIQKGMLALALLAAVAFIPRLIGKLRSKPILSVQTLKQKLDHGEDILVLDVRSAEDFMGEQHHIANALNIPLKDLLSQLDKLTGYLEKPIAIVCRTERCSAKAAQILARNGFADVHVTKGGMSEWNDCGYPVT